MQGAGVETVDLATAGPFRYRELGGAYLITNEVGDWLFLSPAELRAFVEGDLAEDGELRARLAEHRFLAGTLAGADAVARYRGLYAFLTRGPSRHTLVVTLRGGDGDHSDGPSPDMTADTAERAVDCAFMSTSPELTFHFVGGQPLHNEAVVRRAIEYARRKNQLAGKSLRFVVHADPALIDDGRAQWLASDGAGLLAPVSAALLDDADGDARRGLGRYRAACEAAGRAADLTLHLSLSGALLARAVEVPLVAAHVGAEQIVVDSPRHGAAAPAAWLVGWEALLDECIRLGRSGRHVVEAHARTFLARALGSAPGDGGLLRAPAAEGVGELAYHWDGRVFASDEGRRLADEGDELFAIGSLRYHGYHDLVTHETVRAVLLASCSDGQPDCVECAYKPFCGQSPARNYAEQGSIHGRMRDSAWCQRVKGMQDRLFLRLQGPDAEVLRAWI